MSSPSSKIAERLIAHARLCRQFAALSSDESTAGRLFAMADECMKSAAESLTLDQLDRKGAA